MVVSGIIIRMDNHPPALVDRAMVVKVEVEVEAVKEVAEGMVMVEDLAVDVKVVEEGEAAEAVEKVEKNNVIDNEFRTI